MVEGISINGNTAVPKLIYEDIEELFPIQTDEDLEKIEKLLEEDSTKKNKIVRNYYIYIIETYNHLFTYIQFLNIIKFNRFHKKKKSYFSITTEKPYLNRTYNFILL